MDTVDGWLSRDEAAYLGLLTAEAVRRRRGPPWSRSAATAGGARSSWVARPRSGGAGRCTPSTPSTGWSGSAPTGLHHGEPDLGPVPRDHRVGRPAADGSVPTAGRSADLAWEGPISLLLVDGWHDYASVRADVDRFAPQRGRRRHGRLPRPRRLRAGRARVLGELVASGEWERVGLVGTLAAVRRPVAPARSPPPTGAAPASPRGRRADPGLLPDADPATAASWCASPWRCSTARTTPSASWSWSTTDRARRDLVAGRPAGGLPAAPAAADHRRQAQPGRRGGDGGATSPTGTTTTGTRPTGSPPRSPR